MAVLILEGANCTGKSTLAKLFADHTKLEIVKFGIAPQENPFGYFAKGILEAAARCPHFIIDRCHLSNYAYQDLQNSGIMEPPYWQRIDQELRRLEGWLLLMTDDVFQIEARMKERQKDDGADRWGRPKIAMVQRRFEEAFEMSRIETKAQFSLDQFVQDGQLTLQFEDLLVRFRETLE